MKLNLVISCILLLLFLSISILNSSDYRDFVVSKKEFLKYSYLVKCFSWLKYDTFIIIRKNAKKYKVPIELICAVIQHESGGKNIRSRRNYNGSRDYGLMQINSVHVSDCKTLYNIRKNIRIGSWYLSKCLKKAKGNVKEACRMYNGGLHNKRWKYKNWKYVNRIYRDYYKIKTYFYNIDEKFFAFL